MVNKTSPKKCIRIVSNFRAIIPARSVCQMLTNFSRIKFQKSDSKTHCLKFTFYIKRENRKFHVVAVQRPEGNVQKSVMHAQSCCFVNPNLLLFCRFPCRRRRRCLSSLSRVRPSGRPRLRGRPFNS